MQNLELSHQEIVSELQLQIGGFVYQNAVAQATIKKLTAHIEQIEVNAGDKTQGEPTITPVKRPESS